MILEPTENDLLLLSEHDDLNVKKIFTPMMLTTEEKARLLELEQNIIPNVYKKLGLY